MCAAIEAKPAIGSERLILREPAARDIPALVDLANDLGVAAMTERMPHPYDAADAEAFVEKVEAMNPRTDRVFAVEHRQFGLIGVLGFHEKQPRRAELGYWLGRPFWGRGYATEAVRAALGWARSEWRRNVVWAGHFSDNAASGQVLCKAGFLYTGDVERRPSIARGGEAPTRMMVWLA
jgi:RimJ/RimL family protein N-acetyltransferase